MLKSHAVTRAQHTQCLLVCIYNIIIIIMKWRTTNSQQLSPHRSSSYKIPILSPVFRLWFVKSFYSPLFGHSQECPVQLRTFNIVVIEVDLATSFIYMYTIHSALSVRWLRPHNTSRHMVRHIIYTYTHEHFHWSSAAFVVLLIHFNVDSTYCRQRRSHKSRPMHAHSTHRDQCIHI